MHAEAKSTIMTNEHTSLEKYTYHTLFEMVSKGLCVRGELETEQTATYWPPVPLSLAALLSCSAGLLNRGSLCCVLVLPTNSNLSVAPGNIIVCRPPASCGRHICTQFNPSTVKVISWCLQPDAGPKVNMLHSDIINYRELAQICLRDALSVTLIVVGNGIGDLSSNLERVC